MQRLQNFTTKSKNESAYFVYVLRQLLLNVVHMVITVLILSIGTPYLLTIHFNLFITQFVIARFWIQHGSKMDPKNI